jgi:hypothetical protein
MMSEYWNSSPASSPTLSKPTEKVFSPRLALVRQQADDEAGVEPAGQQHADIDVRHQAAVDGGAQGLEHLVLPVLEAQPPLLGQGLEGRRQ